MTDPEPRWPRAQKVVAGDVVGVAVGVDDPGEPPAFLGLSDLDNTGAGLPGSMRSASPLSGAGHQIGENPERPHGFGEDA